jgi:hypothetical protein
VSRAEFGGLPLVGQHSRKMFAMRGENILERLKQGFSEFHRLAVLAKIRDDFALPGNVPFPFAHVAPGHVHFAFGPCEVRH